MYILGMLKYRMNIESCKTAEPYLNTTCNNTHDEANGINMQLKHWIIYIAVLLKDLQCQAYIC